MALVDFPFLFFLFNLIFLILTGASTVGFQHKFQSGRIKSCHFLSFLQGTTKICLGSTMTAKNQHYPFGFKDIYKLVIPGDIA